MRAFIEKKYSKREKEQFWKIIQPFLDELSMEVRAIAACVLLHEGKSKKYVENFIRKFGDLYGENRQFYGYDRDDAVWVCTSELKQAGIDIAEIEAENEKIPIGGRPVFTDEQIRAVMADPEYRPDKLIEMLKERYGE